MKTKLLIILLLTITHNIVFGQSKKELRSTVLRLQSDSTALEQKLTSTLSSLNGEISEVKALNQQLNKQIKDLTTELKSSKDSLSNAISILDNLTNRFSVKLDSINTYSRITNFVNAFYSSLEQSDEEMLRQYEFGDVKFDLENFNSLVSKEARYSKGRVKNLSDEQTHENYFIMLQSIEEIKFSLNKILVKTKVMYSGEKMGLFYNEEQLTLLDNKGLLKLTDWVDLDLYKIAPTLEWNDENFTRDDFYKWIDGRTR